MKTIAFLVADYATVDWKGSLTVGGIHTDYTVIANGEPPTASFWIIWIFDMEGSSLPSARLAIDTALSQEDRVVDGVDVNWVVTPNNKNYAAALVGVDSLTLEPEKLYMEAVLSLEPQVTFRHPIWVVGRDNDTK